MKNNKGITLTVLVITVLVIILLSSTITVAAVKNYKIIKLKNMYADLQLLTEKVSIYFLENQNIPIKEQITRPDFLNNESDRNINDNDIYYELDISKLKNISLNNTEDIYIINQISHEIYSVKGAELDGKQYHKLPVEDYKYEPKIYYNIIYELDDGELPETAPSQYCTGIETELQEPSRRGYKFDGWYLSSSFSNVSKIEKISASTTGEITVYAKWIAIK